MRVAASIARQRGYVDPRHLQAGRPALIDVEGPRPNRPAYVVLDKAVARVVVRQAECSAGLRVDDGDHENGVRHRCAITDLCAPPGARVERSSVARHRKPTTANTRPAREDVVLPADEQNSVFVCDAPAVMAMMCELNGACTTSWSVL